MSTPFERSDRKLVKSLDALLKGIDDLKGKCFVGFCCYLLLFSVESEEKKLCFYVVS